MKLDYLLPFPMDKHSKIAILGFGLEGRALLKWLVKHGYTELTVCDQNVDLETDLPDGVSTKLGPHYLNDLDDFDVIFRSPGISVLKPEIQAAATAGAEITSGTKFFIDQCPCDIVGVTGTKGKGTTCTLIESMLKEAGKKNVYLGGNIGKSPMVFLDKLKGDSLVILELSSFQLQDVEKAPHYSVLLNTTIDHLDYHADQEEYMEAKERILSLQNKNSLAVLNKDYEYVKYYKPLVKGELCEVSVKGKVKNGAYVENDQIFVKGKKITSVDKVKLVGAHNLENILPAALIAYELGADVKDIAKVIENFENLPHRLQFVRELNGIKFYNDSYSTNGSTSMAAVDSFDVPTVLIAGGYDKGIDYKEWAIKILTKPSLITVVLIGDTAQKMEEALLEADKQLGSAAGSPTKVLRRNTMEEAVIDAYAESDEGGVVVMSPAAASFDMYKNYKERGNEFSSHARKLQ